MEALIVEDKKKKNLFSNIVCGGIAGILVLIAFILGYGLLGWCLTGLADYLTVKFFNVHTTYLDVFVFWIMAGIYKIGRKYLI